MQAGGYPSYYSVVYLSPSLPAQPPEQDSKGTEPRETSGNNSSAGSGTASPRSSQGYSSPQAKMTITPFPEPPAPAALVSPQAQVQNLNQVQSPGKGPPQDQSRGQATAEIRTPAPTPQPPPTSAVTSAPPEKKPVMGQVGSNSTNSAKTKTSSTLQHGLHLTTAAAQRVADPGSAAGGDSVLRGSRLSRPGTVPAAGQSGYDLRNAAGLHHVPGGGTASSGHPRSWTDGCRLPSGQPGAAGDLPVSKLLPPPAHDCDGERPFRHRPLYDVQHDGHAGRGHHDAGNGPDEHDERRGLWDRCCTFDQP
ncbi:hypothetical protein C0Q70_12188 [Pomacea canaliculata]|uniref:Uncharacterized protein n=1 Tax=Pomacea canaliculata TaxID=400727 RepID=A0A2T7P0T4_POMCA|nr:hypothetical protein C0Q70_12188 [Pomacea canaliculata]